MTRRQFLVAGMGVGAVSLGVTPSIPAPASLGVGVIGVGEQGQRLLAHLLSIPSVRVIAVCDLSNVALSAAAELPGVQEATQFTQDAKAVIRFGDVQAVVIATPDGSHAALAAASLEAGKDVYVEAPLAHPASELDRLRALAQARGRILYVHDAIAAHSGYTAVSAILQSGILGNVSRIHVVRRTPVLETNTAPDHWRNHRTDTLGTAIQDAAHSLQIVQRVMNAFDPVSLTGHGGIYVWQDGCENPDTLYLIASYAEGFTVSFATYPGNPARDEFVIYGTRGALDLVHWRITPESAVESPIPAAIATHTTAQLARLAPVQSRTAMGISGWLNAIARRDIHFPEQAAHQVQLAERIASALDV